MGVIRVRISANVIDELPRAMVFSPESTMRKLVPRWPRMVLAWIFLSGNPMVACMGEHRT